MLSILLANLKFWWDHGFAPGDFSPLVSAEATCRSHPCPHDTWKNIILNLSVLSIYSDFLDLCSKVEYRWVRAYKPVFWPLMMALSSINQQVCESTGCYLIELDHWLILSSGMCFFSLWSKNPPLGKTATEIAVFKGLIEINRLLEEAT
jgi:hypothetical protein